MMKSAVGKLLVAGLVMTVAVPASEEPRLVPQLRLSEAQAIANKVVEVATAKGLMVSVVVVNREGKVILSQRMDDASFVSLKVAERKAVTAAVIGAPTQALEQMPDKDKLPLMSLPDLITIAGGVPVILSGKTVAGVGVSGAASSDDHAMAEGGVKTVLK